MATAVAQQQKSPPAPKSRPAFVVVPKPNEEIYRKKEEFHQSKISELQAEMAKLQDNIRSKQGGFDEFRHRREEVRSRIESIQKSISELEAERKQLANQLVDLQERSRLKRNQVLTMKKDLQYDTEEQIDEKIRELEHFMITTSVSLQRERDLVQQLQQLKKLKPKVSAFAALENDSRTTDTRSLTSIRSRLEEIREELNKLFERKREEQTKVSALVEDRQKSQAPVKQLHDKKNELNTDIATQKQALLDIKMEKNQATQQYAAYIQRLRVARREQEQDEKRRKALLEKRVRLERELEKLESAEESLPELVLLRQTIEYVGTLSNKAAAGDTESAHHHSHHRGGSESPETASSPTNAEGGDSTEPGPEGAEYAKLVPKKERREEFYCAPVKKKGNKKASRKQGSRKANADAIIHDMHTLSDFQLLSVDPPFTFGEVDRCLEQLHANLEKIESGRQGREEASAKRRAEIQRELDALDRQEKMEENKLLQQQQQQCQENEGSAANVRAAAINADDDDEQ